MDIFYFFLYYLLLKTFSLFVTNQRVFIFVLLTDQSYILQILLGIRLIAR